MKIVWPLETETSGNLPAEAEVYLIQGYIDYDCTRLTWKDGRIQAERTRVMRTWFYNTRGEGFEAQQFEVSLKRFVRAWGAASLLLGAKVEPRQPPSSQRQDSLEENLEHGHMAIRTSSQAPYVWVPDRPLHADLEKRENGRSLNDNPLADIAPRDLEERDRVLLETSLRILGETGHEPAVPVIKELRDRLLDATEKKAYWAYCIRRETDYALAKIHFLTHWNASEAMDLVHRNPRRWHSDDDLAKWVRTQFFERDPKAYQGQLVVDLASRVRDASLLRETIAELAKRYPGKAQTEIRRMLTHACPEVAADAAFVLLSRQADDHEVLAVLDRLAGDVTAKVPSHAEYFDCFARNRALTYLYSKKAAQGVAWDANRIRRQLAQAGEDGRMVHELLSALEILNASANETEAIAAHRRVLTGPRNKGILVACEELIKRKDRASASTIGSVLKEIAANCNKGLQWQEDSTAKYPWTDKYGLESIQHSLKTLEKP
jgi:hypothetical protein